MKVVREVDEKRGILQVTAWDERWYMRGTKDLITGLPTHLAYPSVTWKASYWPNKFLEEWRAKKGFDEAEEIKIAAGDKGSAVHLAIEMILKGDEFRHDTKIVDKNRSTEQDTAMRPLTFEELLCVQSFIDWRNEVQPETIATETVVWSDQHQFAGTVDYVCRINGEVWLIDWKTSKAVHRAHKMQVAAYREAFINGENVLPELNPNGTETGKLVDVSGMKMAILQLGYQGNKDGYKWTEIDENPFPQFLIASQIWKEEHTSKKNGALLTPGYTKRDFPIVLSPAAQKAEPVDAIYEDFKATDLHGDEVVGAETPRLRVKSKKK